MHSRDTNQPPLERRLGERITAVASDLYRIALPTRFPVGDVNAWLLDGPAPILVDTGVLGDASFACLEAAFAAIGRRVEDISQVLLTHSHVDHAGAAARIVARSGCTVRAHPRAVPRLADVHGAWSAGGPWFERFMLRSGFGEVTTERFRSSGAWFLRFVESCPAIEPLRSGERIVLGSRSLLVHEARGHTSDHVLFELEGEGVVLLGDHVLEAITPNPTLEAPLPGDAEKPLPLLDYRESLERTASLALTLACPGHGAPFYGLAERCRAILALQAERCDAVSRLLDERGPMTRKALSRELFGAVPLWEVYLTVSEVQAALELLIADGRLRLHGAGEHDLYEVIPS